ncbi:MAG: hypothetical protein Fur0014_10600 [Rubrivivax sp.]
MVVPALPLLAFPWAVWPPVWRGLRALAAPGAARSEPGLRFVFAWALPVFLALCAISGKQVHYLLPLFPAAALLGARALREAGPPRRFDAGPVVTLGGRWSGRRCSHSDGGTRRTGSPPGWPV